MTKPQCEHVLLDGNHLLATDNSRAIEAGFIFELAPKLEKAAIQEGACKKAVPHPPKHIQVLDPNPSITYSDVCGRLVGCVFPDIGDARVETSQVASRLSSVT